MLLEDGYTVRVALVSLLASPDDDLARRVADKLLIGGGEFVIDGFAHDDRYVVEEVVRIDDVLLNFIKLRRHDNFIGVLLSRDRPLLEREVKFAEGQRGRVRAKRLPVLYVIFVLHRAELESFEVVYLGDRLV